MGRINKYNIAEAALLVVAAYLGWWLWQTYGLAMSIVIITSALLLFIGCLFLAEYYSTKDRDLLPPAGLVFTGLAVLGSLAFGDSSLAAASFAILIGLGVVVIFKSYWESKQLRDKLR